MNKTAIQKFAIWARTDLIEQVAQRAYQYGIDANGYGDATAESIGGRLLTAEEKAQRCELIQQIDAKGYEQVMEEVAYTWFNRFIALRFMEVNNYLPSHIRVFSDASGAFKPEILSDVLHLELPGLDTGKVAEYIENNDTEGLYRYLLLTQCNALNESLPRMFERMGGYTEMLLPNNILKPDSVLGRMVTDIPEEDWQDAVQIIGWLYQYYNTELNEIVYDGSMSKSKVPKELLPAATTIYTPDWAIRYMVENSLGHLWIEGHPNDALRADWKYYLDEPDQEPEVEAQLVKLREEYAAIKPEEIKVIDPCMGSGHILVYAFDVLMQIYTSTGWSEREAAQSILKNNLYGLDIDDRAAQLAYFAVMMKARQYDRRLLTRGIQPNVYAIHESNHIPSMAIEYFHQGDERLKTDIERLVTAMYDAKEYGSILSVAPVDFARLYIRFEEIRDEIHMMQPVVMDELLPMVQCVELLAQKYDVVVTNPPYFGSSRFNAKLSTYVASNYADVKSDLSMVMYKHALRDLCNVRGFVSFITTTSWMFLPSFEKLRKFILAGYDIVSLVDFGTELFEGKVGHNPIVAWVNRKSHTDCVMTGIRLVDYCYSRRDEKRTEFFNKENYHYSKQSNFSKIPGAPVAYWVSERFVESFVDGQPLTNIAPTRKGMFTGDNDRWLKLWHEVSASKIPYKFKPYNKGGEFRRWYGNHEYVVDWSNNGQDIITFRGSGNINTNMYFKPCITWSLVTSYKPSFRLITDTNHVMGDAGPVALANSEELFYILALLNSKYVEDVAALIAPTINFSNGVAGNIPVIIDKNKKQSVNNLSKKCVINSCKDWDSYEISWDFKRSPLV